MTLHISPVVDSAPLPDTAQERIETIARRAAMAGLNLAQARHLFDVLYIADAMRRHGGNRVQAAETLGIDRVTLHRMSVGHRT